MRAPDHVLAALRLGEVPELRARMRGVTVTVAGHTAVVVASLGHGQQLRLWLALVEELQSWGLGAVAAASAAAAAVRMTDVTGWP